MASSVVNEVYSPRPAVFTSSSLLSWLQKVVRQSLSLLWFGAAGSAAAAMQLVLLRPIGLFLSSEEHTQGMTEKSGIVRSTSACMSPSGRKTRPCPLGVPCYARQRFVLQQGPGLPSGLQRCFVILRLAVQFPLGSIQVLSVTYTWS